MRRWPFRALCFVCCAFNVVMVKLGTIPWLSAGAAAFIAAVWLNQERMWHGTRRAARDRDYPGDEALAAALNAGFTPPQGASTGMIETVHADVPILAYKQYPIVFQGNGAFRLIGNGPTVIERDMTATCIAGGMAYRMSLSAYGDRKKSCEHAPTLDCNCGFHALRERPDDGRCWVTVELSGTVISHERGYRAEHQRVISVELPGCFYCGAEPCKAGINESTTQHQYGPETKFILRFVCDDHRPPDHEQYVWIDAAIVAKQMPGEVCWSTR